MQMMRLIVNQFHMGANKNDSLKNWKTRFSMTLFFLLKNSDKPYIKNLRVTK